MWGIENDYPWPGTRLGFHCRGDPEVKGFFLRSPFPLQPHSSTSSAFGPRRRRNIYCRVGLDCWLPFLVPVFSPLPPSFQARKFLVRRRIEGEKGVGGNSGGG